MSIRLEMLQVARLAPKQLDDAAGLVATFLLSKQNPDGGFGDRDGQSDIYYTVFGVEGIVALQLTPNIGALRNFLESRKPEKMDFIHLCCLARVWAGLEMLGGGSCPNKQLMVDRLETFRSADGGYNIFPKSKTSGVYGCFMGFAAYQDLRMHIPEREKLKHAIAAAKAPDGGWANEPGMLHGATNSTAAAVTLLHALNSPIPPGTGDWLLKQVHSKGGFLAVPDAPVPDLLSTATALHALSILQKPIGPMREKTLDFIDTLWTNEGGFFGHWADDHLDCEYTYYGLLALGHLSV